MQAIARVNRVFRDKPAGLVVDYIGIAQNLKNALSQYSSADREKTGIDEAQAVAVLLEKLDVVRAMAADTGHTSTEMRVDGGAVANSLLMQFQADLTGVRIIRPSVMESTALGVAMFAGLAVGFWHSTDEICALLKPDRTFSPEAAPALMEQRRKRWHEAVRRSRHWVEE